MTTQIAIPIYSNDPEHADFGVEDKKRGKVYVGVLSVLDIIIFYLDKTQTDGKDPEDVLSFPLSHALGSSKEGSRIWVAWSDATIGDAMDTLSKGVHRLLVPVEVDGDKDTFEFHVLSQLDLVKFLYSRFSKEPKLQAKAEMTLLELDLVSADDADGLPSENASMVISVEPRWNCSKALRLMADNYLNAVAVVPASPSKPYILSTLSLSDLRSIPLQFLNSDPTVEELLCRVHKVDEIEQLRSKLVTVKETDPLQYTVEKMLSSNIHRVWVVGEGGAAKDVVSLTNVLKVLLLEKRSVSAKRQ
ncbi:UNVERIFIED_CONTAM: hypothetical protein HDU68_012221 [Siphonaria sp. JEL0065]|nr:hypothetical protein HDU68_012221 [Siphonaria sp. JEL0065]